MAASPVGAIWESGAMRQLLVVDQSDRAALHDVDDGRRVVLDGRPEGEASTGEGLTGAASARPRPSATSGRTVTAAWSPAGRWVAWSVDDANDVDGAREVRLCARADAEPLDPAGAAQVAQPRVVASALEAFYLLPSPCGSYLSHLSPGPLGLELGVTDLASGELRIIERGQPLFWSWSPDSSRLAVHAGERVFVSSVDGAVMAVLSEQAGSFVAPWWMPDGSVVVASDEHLVSHGPDGSAITLARHPGTARFALDPDGRRLAFVDLVDTGPVLVALDLLTGERVRIATEATAAFQWSPDGRRLAALVSAGPGHLQWLVSSGDEVTRLPPFRPAPGWLREVVPFFEQYSHSHAVWSADGRHLVAPGRDREGSPIAVVQAVDQAGDVPQGEPHPTAAVPGARLAWWAEPVGDDADRTDQRWP
jgi:Tol biopolymer transport system component